jgi:hypothetical protein
MTGSKIFGKLLQLGVYPSSLGNPITTRKIKIIEKFLAIVSDRVLRRILTLPCLVSFIERKVSIISVNEIFHP